jgi:hypothetical protein
MSALYRNELLNEAGIAESRVFDTEYAVAQMHKALCMMDTRNRKLFVSYVESCGGVLGLVQRYAELEHLNDLK